MKVSTKRIIALLLSVLVMTMAWSTLIVFAEPNVVEISNCDTLSGWSNYPGDGMAIDNSNQSEGSGCLKFYQTGGFCSLYKMSTPMDMSTAKYFVFDINPQATDWFQKSGYANIVISSRDDQGGWDEPESAAWTEECLIIPLSSFNLEEGWNTINVPLDFTKAKNGFDVTSVKKLAIFGLRYYERGDQVNVNYIDNVRLSDTELDKTAPVNSKYISYQKVANHADQVYALGQSTFTSSSWDKFVTAYNAAKEMNVTEASTDAQIAAAKKELQRGMNFLTSKTNKNELDELYSHVVVLGIDGMGNFNLNTETPNIARIMNQPDALYTTHAQSVMPTISAQNWGAMLTGVTPEKHGKTNDLIESTATPDHQQYPSIFRYLRDKYPEAELTSFNNWTAINNGIVEHNLDVNMYAGDDSSLADQMSKYFEENDSLFTFVQFDNVDHAGHAHGYQSDAYYQELRTVDGYIGQVYDALEAQGYLEDTLLILLTDHGGIGTNHGGNTQQELNCTYIAKGKSVTPGEFAGEITTASLSSVVCAALGVPQSGDYDYTVSDGYFKGYTYEAPKTDDWKLENYRDHATTTQPKEIALDDVIDTSSLKAHFKFDNNLKNSVSDSSITANYRGTRGYGDGYFGKSASLKNGYISIDGLNIDENSFTVSTWLNDINVSFADPALFGNKDWNSGANQGILVAVENNKIKLNTANASGRADTEYTEIDNYDFEGDSGWINLTVVVNRENSTATLYVDFKPFASVSIPNGSFASVDGTTFVLGQDGTGNSPYKAELECDEFMYFDKAISQAELNALASYYKMSDVDLQKLNAVNNVYKMINDIGEVTQENYKEKISKIEAAEQEYSKIVYQFGEIQVDNEPVLDAAIEAYNGYVENEEPIFGDVNGDKEVTTADALLALQAAVNKIELTSKQQTAADVDGEEGIATLDALLILQKAVNKIDIFPVEKQLQQ